MAKFISSLFMVAILFTYMLILTTCVARPEPFLTKTDIQEGEKEGKKGGEVEELSCEDVAEKEECLMRRTLVAHIDYIYTQNVKP